MTIKVKGTIVLRKDDFDELTPPQMTRHFDTFNHNGEDMIIPGIARYGPMTISGVRVTPQLNQQIMNAWQNYEATPFEIDFDEDKFQFKAFVDSFSRTSSIDSVDSCDVRLRITGPVNIVSLKEVRKVTAQKIRNRFYVAHPKVHIADEQNQDNVLVPRRILSNGKSVHARWTKKTLKLAVEHAEEILEANPEQDEAYVVQIVRRVRRRKLPMIVESVR